ncbi:MAG: hypothetical protein WCL25_00400 [bacterium]
MKFEQLRKTVKEVGFETSRADNENYLEIVIVKDKLSELILRLDNLFGPPQNQSSPQAQKAIKEFGGIIKGQTLYFWHEDSSFIFAMLWPWQDGEHITIKMAKGLFLLEP